MPKRGSAKPAPLEFAKKERKKRSSLRNFEYN